MPDNVPLLPQDYKCGISIRYSGAEGVDWIAEDMFHEPLQNSRRTVYIKAATQISLFHNELNVLAKGATGSTAVLVSTGKDGIIGNADDGNDNMPGIIRYRVDGDMNIGKEVWAWPPTTTKALPPNNLKLPAYTTPLSFATLTYEPYESALAVLGKVGNNGQALSAKTNYYHYGVLDNAGDEWHSLQIGDDDYDSYSAEPNPKEVYWASDGKEQLFIVNPKTPCITVARTGNGQFYSTPAKVYYVPIIHDQTTYLLPLTGTVSVTLTNIYGGVVEYRLNGGEWTSNGTAVVTLPDSVFTTGINTLQCRYASTPTVIRTRTVVKNPSFPSAGESHGNLMWADDNEFQKIKARLARSPYTWYMNSKILGDPGTNLRKKWDDFGEKGHRRWAFGSYFTTNTAADINAFAALIKGWDSKPTDATKSYAQYAKGMLLENVLNLDPVGIYTSTSSMPAPMTENRGAGYYFVTNTYSTAIAYDLLIAHYRSNQHPDGITPIEDYFIRDMLGSNALNTFTSFRVAEVGLWGTALASGVLMSGLAMPDYDTPYYGTAGYNGTTNATHLWTPFPDDVFTWKQVLTDRVLAPTESASLSSPRVVRYPNRSATYDIENVYHTLFCPGGFWKGPNLGYFNLMTQPFWVTTNLAAIHTPTAHQWPVIHEAYLNSVKGVMTGSCGTGTPAPSAQQLGTINNRHPTVAAFGRQALIDGGGAAEVDTLLKLLWYDDIGEVGAAPAAPTSLSVI